MLRQTLVTINDTQVMRWTPPRGRGVIAGRTNAIASAPSTIHPAAYTNAATGAPREQ